MRYTLSNTDLTCHFSRCAFTAITLLHVKSKKKIQTQTFTRGNELHLMCVVGLSLMISQNSSQTDFISSCTQLTWWSNNWKTIDGRSYLPSWWELSLARAHFWRCLFLSTDYRSSVQNLRSWCSHSNQVYVKEIHATFFMHMSYPQRKLIHFRISHHRCAKRSHFQLNSKSSLSSTNIISDMPNIITGQRSMSEYKGFYVCFTIALFL